MRREKIKRGARNGPPIKPKFLLEEDDWLDVLDGDGVWNVARVLSVPSPYEVKITYDGWPKDYDEVLSIDSHRVAPYHTFTWTVKCWVKYLNWPLWPSLITMRLPGTTAGIKNLAAENRLFVDFLDNPSFAKRDRCWQKKTKAQPFEKNYDSKRTGSTGESFERALGWVLQSDASSKMPKFAVGTVPVEYKLSPVKSVETVRKDMGDKLWFQNFLHSKRRHQMNYVYKTIGFEEDDRSSKDSMPLTLNKSLSNLSVMNVEPQLVTNEKKRPAGIEIDQNRRMGKQVSYELELMDGSDGSDNDDVQNTCRPKRRCLQTKRRPDGLSKTRKVEQEEPHMSKTPKSAAQLATKDARANHSKGRAKMAAKRRVPPIGEHVSLNASVKQSTDNSEVGEAQSVPIVAKLDTVSKRSAADNCAKWSRRNGLNADFDHSFEVEASIVLSMRFEAMIERQSAEAKKKKTARQHLAAGKVSRYERVGRNGRSISSTRSQGNFQPISPCLNKMESHPPRSSNLDVSRRAGEMQVSSGNPKMNVHREEETMETTTGISKHSKELGCSRISASKIVSSDSDEVNDNMEEKGSIQQGDLKDLGTCVKKHHSTLLDSDGCNQELRRRFCVMQADQEDADATETVKCSKKTVISVPRKFKEVSASQIPTDSMVGIAPPPRLRNMASSVQTGAALAAPSTIVFSSSNGFSMESWFKRKLMTDFMGSGT